MEHSFDIDIAEKVGVNAAILYKNIKFWCAKNKANDVHFHDGHYWTYNSKKAFTELFPYMTERQVDYALNKLLEANYIIKGNYNKSPYDKTLWYADIFCVNDTTKLCNQDHKNVQPIPNSKPQLKTNDISKDISSEQPSKFQFGKSEPKKPNLYQNCIALINNYTEDCKIRQFLKNYLDLCMEMKCIRGANQWKGMLNTLDRVSNGSRRCDIIQNSIDHGWKTFYPLNQNDFKNKKDFNVKSDIEMIEENDYDKYDHTKSERSF